MWPKAYKDYPKDTSLIQQKVEPSKGIIGCEMHDINGWGESHHQHPKPRKRGLIYTLLTAIFGTKKQNK
jgi:hypothetical protein